MELMKIICPDAPYVWNQDGVSKCFDNLYPMFLLIVTRLRRMEEKRKDIVKNEYQKCCAILFHPLMVFTVLGFGVNTLTVAVAGVIWISDRSQKEWRTTNYLARVLLILAAFGAFLSFVDIIMLLGGSPNANSIPFDKWMDSCSEFSIWAAILTLSRSTTWLDVLSNSFFCFWWIIRLVLLIPRSQIIFASVEVVNWIVEISAAVTNIMFGVVISIIRMRRASYCKSFLVDPLLPHKRETTGDPVTNLGIMSKILHLMAFKIIDPVMQHGVNKQLDFENLLQLPIDMDPLSCHDLLLRMWNSQKAVNLHPSLFKAIYLAYGWPYFWVGLLKVLNDCLGFAGPLVLNMLIRFLQQGSRNPGGYFLAISLGLVSVLKSFLDTQYSFRLAQIRLKMRSSIMTIIYRKCLFVSLAERSKFSEGEIQTFMSVDADRVVNLCNSVHDLWSLPLQIGVAIYLLYRQVKFAFVSGVAITILLIPVNKWIANLIANATQNMMEQKDERIRMTAELLTYIRTLKMYGWETLFASWLKKRRSSEVTYLSTRKYLDAWCVFFWATTPTLFSLFTFGLYSLMGHQLDAATVFTCLALFNNLISPLNSFPWVINGLIDASISMRRLTKYLSSYESGSEFNSSSPILFEENLESVEPAVAINDATCTWSSYDEKEFDLDLEHVNLLVPKGCMVAIVGEVGSGKSSLLNLILGEARLVHGSTYLTGSKAYVPQVPWITSGTIRDNILLGKDYEPRRYAEVLQACSLDLDISLMMGGDMACTGEKGNNLSGGQRARLALARALYHGSDTYLLDDVLSAVDAHVAQHILHYAILGPLVSQKTRILCTHNTQAIYSADMVIVMDKGHIKWVGSSADSSLASYITVMPVSVNEFNTFADAQSKKLSYVHFELGEGEEVERPGCSNDPQEIFEAELRKEGQVESVVYKNYAAFAGWFITIITCLSAILMQASRNGNDLWLSFWVDTAGSTKSKYSTTFYLVILCIFCITNSSLTLVRAFSFAFGGLRAAVKVHDRLLHNLIDAPVSFFNQTPTGRILNRLSSDLYTIDDSLPFILNILLANFVGLLGIAIVLSFVQVIFLLLLIPFWFFYSKLQSYYRSTSRELRRLDSVSRSPIYASFTETLDGSSTIRAFSSVDAFLFRFVQHVQIYQRTSYSEIIASLWLSLRLQLLAAFIVSFVAVMAIVGTHGHVPISLVTPGLVGLALSYASPIVSLLGSFLTSFTETEKEMISVERVLQYMDIPQETLSGENPITPNWPSKGEIQFHNVTLRYTPSSSPALLDVSFSIPGGKQVGIVGRTGAGKSSILNVLFRLNSISSGCVLVDGLDIFRLPVRDLRTKLAIVPQTPFLFKGSLRSNLDPLETSTDEKIWDTLERCCLKEEIEAAGGLDIQVKECGRPFSVGQRQLLCLARALLKSCQVLCLDECTSNVDTQTVSKLQKAMLSERGSQTVITIAHRISTVLFMDNIFILDQGTLVEQGNPQLLLQDKSSRFSNLSRASRM